jgi:cellulose synthase/poly-beta-1,6-N-acetylglucosamine synthase-like glycosyltransferase
MFVFFTHIIFYILFTYLFLTSLYFFVVAMAGRIKRGFEYGIYPEKKKIALFIPSYKEDQIIIETAGRALEQSYAKDKYEVFVIADHLQQSTLERLRTLPVQLIEVDFDISTKAKSLHEALVLATPMEFDIAVILDADNIMSADCLEKINCAFARGYKAVQCHRVAKNKNNAVAILDVASEEINNHLFRRGQRALGFSSSLIGSGMAFDFRVFQKIFNLPIILENPGEDREIDLQLMKEGIEVEFIEDAYVFDEKVSSAAVFENQRLRWLEAQFNNIRRFFDKDIRSHSGNPGYWYKLFQTLLLPRSLYLVAFFVIFCCLLAMQFSPIPFMAPPVPWWYLAMALYASALLISLPLSLYNWNLFKALISLPLLVLSMTRAIFRMKKNRKEFIHTPKVHTEKV